MARTLPIIRDTVTAALTRKAWIMHLPDPLEFAQALARSATLADACEAHGLPADLTDPAIADLVENAVSYGLARPDGCLPHTVLCDDCNEMETVIFALPHPTDRDWIGDPDAASVPDGWHVARVVWGDPAHPTGDVLEVVCPTCWGTEQVLRDYVEAPEHDPEAPARTYRITLDITTTMARPDDWAWEEIIDLGDEESLRVVECRRLRPEDD